MWLAEHGVDERSARSLQDPFDYPAEDLLIDAWRQAIAGMPDDLFTQEPGYTRSYSGPGGSVRKSYW